MQYIDLTLQVGKNNKVYKWAELQLQKDIVMGHVGTHIDVYEKPHIPLEYMQRRGIVFDVSHIKDRDITSDDIDLDYVKEGDFVLIRTGSIEKYPYGSKFYFEQSVSLSWELIEGLVEEKISFIGIDAPDLRKKKEHVKADQYCELHGVYVVENLINLNEVDPDKVCKILTMWHEDKEATGIRCRVVAVQPQD